MLRVFHYRSKCIGCNACVEADKSRWRMSRKDGKCILIGGENKKGVFRTEVDESEHDDILKAVKNCPVKIIRYNRI
jgi:ferredoxin